MSLPYFPMFPTDFETDTSHLTLAEDGAYNRLLRLVWMSPGCSLPDDDAWILRRMRCHSDEDCAVVIGIIDEFFTRSNGRVSNARLTREFEKTKEAHEKRVSAGSKGGKAKSLKSLAAAPSNAKAKLKQPEPEPYKTCTNVHDADASPDPSKLIWDSGIKILMAAGKSRNQAGGIVGKWRKSHADADLISALGACQREGAVDPVAYITGALKSRKSAPAAAEIW